MDAKRKDYAEEMVRLRTGREVPEYLRELYVERRYTDQEIAGFFGVSRQAVQGWRRKHGIKRTDRQAVA